jgi:Peptidase family S41/N-terminal domain of Peptidase_S41 in eukaryotic IRBP
MSEKMYERLLRLLLPRFYNAYGEAALQLFRDRARDERGFVPTLRLWWDLLADLAISVHRERHFAQSALIGASGPRNVHGMPSFHAVESAPPRTLALIFGGVLSLLALGAFPALISGSSRVSMRTAGNGTGLDSGKPRWGGSIWSSLPFVHSFSHAPEIGSIRMNGTQPPTVLSFTMRALPPGAVVQDFKLDAAERKRVVDGVISNLKEYYVYPEVAQKMADALAAHLKAGDDDAETDGAAFAEILTKQLRDVSHDRHLRVVYKGSSASGGPPPASPENDADFRKFVERHNCAFSKAEILPDNVGYLKLDAFAPPSLCRATAVAAFGFLAHVDAIIFDLRENHGGDPHMVALIASYLFDHPTHLNDIYNRRENSTQQFWTSTDIPGAKLVNQPAFVLTSGETFSGAEEFTYDLKNLKRAIIVGEKTGGGAHLVAPHRIDDHFGIGVPFARAINPVSKTDWEGTGIEPDVKVKASDALETAEKLAENKLQKE